MLKPQVQQHKDKEKTLGKLGIAPPKGASAQANPKLNDIANVINGVENPKAEKASSTDPKINFPRAERLGDMPGAAKATRDLVVLQETLGVPHCSAYKSKR